MVYGENKPKIHTFTDLEAWKESHALAIEVYLITKTFPKDEQFGLVSQMRRAAVSISSNIAEGFSRVSPKEKCNFYSFSKGSLTELYNQFLIARDISYVSAADYNRIQERIDRAGRLLTGLLQYARNQSKKVKS